MSAILLDVLLAVEMGVGENWLEAHYVLRLRLVGSGVTPGSSRRLKPLPRD
jgi:hypothetical protein